MNDFPRSWKIATVWLLLGVAVFLAVQTWQRRELAERFSVQGGVIEIQRAADGHYHWPGTLNGRRIEFLVDTGATVSAIPGALAQELGLPHLGTTQSRTAGGPVTGSIVVADLALQGGLRVDRLRLGALPALDSPLLGMDVLGRLRIQQMAGVLRIELGSSAR